MTTFLNKQLAESTLNPSNIATAVACGDMALFCTKDGQIYSAGKPSSGKDRLTQEMRTCPYCRRITSHDNCESCGAPRRTREII